MRSVDSCRSIYCWVPNCFSPPRWATRELMVIPGGAIVASCLTFVDCMMYGVAEVWTRQAMVLQVKTSPTPPLRDQVMCHVSPAVCAEDHDNDEITLARRRNRTCGISVRTSPPSFVIPAPGESRLVPPHTQNIHTNTIQYTHMIGTLPCQKVQLCLKPSFKWVVWTPPKKGMNHNT